MLLLRGIYDIMQRAPGDIEAKYKAGFNICVYKLTLISQPAAFWKDQIVDGILTMDTLTPYGKLREREVKGEVELSEKSLRKYGKTTTRADMKNSTRDKMKKLRKLLGMVRATTAEEGMPPEGSTP